MGNRRNFRRRQSVRENSPNSAVEFELQDHPHRAEPLEETRDGRLSASVRPEKVARARRLAQDENYPSKEIIDPVAGLLAKHLQPGPE